MKCGEPTFELRDRSERARPPGPAGRPSIHRVSGNGRLPGSCARRRRPHRPLLQRVHDQSEFGVVRRQAEGRLVPPQRLGCVPTLTMDLCQPFDRGEILRCCLEHRLEFTLGRLEMAETRERSAKRDPRRRVPRVDGKAGATDGHRPLILTGAPVLLGELRKQNRRRILEDPASQFLETRTVRHRRQSTVWSPTSKAVRCDPRCRSR